jgi:hypothetical protein
VTRHHLLTVWNPAYEQDAMELHLRVLREAVRRYRESDGDEEAENQVFVWWGKVRSANRYQELPHIEQVLALDAELATHGAEAETHLYLTDYRSLYVAHVGEVTRDDPRDDEGERDHVPAYYAKQQRTCDCWFRLWEIRRLVTDDTLSVVAELQNLRNVRYHDRPVSIYGGMIELPLVVTESEDVQWFEHEVRDRLTDGKFWVEFDAERVGIGMLERELRENLFGDTAWEAFDPATRSFIAAGEKIWRDHAADPAFDFSPVIVEFGKALEVRCNWALRQALQGAPPEVRVVNIDGKSVDLGRGPLLSLGQLARVLGESQPVNERCRRRLQGGDWFAASVPPILDALSKLLNPGSHSARVDRDAAGQWRRQLMGVGCEGEFVRLGRVRVK